MLNSRLKAYLSFKGLTVRQMERDIEVGGSTMAKALKNDGSIGSDKVEKILQVYPDLSAEWLMRGEGNMILGEGDSIADKMRIRMLEKQIDSLTTEKDNYWTLLQHMLNEKK